MRITVHISLGSNNTKCIAALNHYKKPQKQEIYPSVTAWVKISQNVDILAKVYLVHLKVEHRQTLRVLSTFTG